MDITERAKNELENRIRKLEDFIATRGVGSTHLTKARRVQRNTNLAIILGGAVTVAGIVAWAIRNSDEH